MAVLDGGAVMEGYRIESLLGQGGMGVVYRATQLSLDRTVALKVLSADLSGDPAFQERFRREGTLQAALDHPNIVTVYEAGESEFGLFLAMRYIEGPNLKELIRRGELDPPRTIHILRQAAAALDAAHEIGLVHRDVKPQNIVVDERREDRAYLADFGITKELGGRGMTRTGDLVGTLDYIAPEQIEGHSATTRSDIYALTATLYECLTGSVPYPRDADAAIIYAHLSERPASLADHGLPEALDAVIDRGMAREPLARHSTCRELIDEAAVAVAELATPRSARTTVVDTPVTAQRDESEAEPSWRAHAPSWSTRVVASVVVVLALACGGLATGWMTSGDAPSAPIAAVGDLEVTVPQGWRTLESQPSVDGVQFSRALGLAPSDDRGTPAVVVGDLAGSLTRSLTTGTEIVRLGDAEAYHFRGDPELYVVPGEGSGSTVACIDPSTRVQCGRIAASLRLSRPLANMLSGRYALAAEVQRIASRLDRRVAAPANALVSATSAGRQATAAAGVAGAYRAAAEDVRNLSLPSYVDEGRDALADALAEAESRYQALATAGLREDESQWREAGKQAVRAEQAASQAVAATTAIRERPSV